MLIHKFDIFILKIDLDLYNIKYIIIIKFVLKNKFSLANFIM